jgi:hypothetical protein
MDDDVHPIYNYLKRSGWSDSLDLLKCTNVNPPEDFSLNGDDDDPFKVIMRPADKPTDLFKALQMRDWGVALDCVHKRPTEAKTWIYRETDFPNNEMLWKVLPLHAAIAIGSPAYLILELLQAYPDAAKKWDLHNSLPIHIAAARIDQDTDGERILNHLLKEFPESAGVQNGKGLTPIKLAYGAQLRKDKQKKIHSWCIDTREPEGEGGGFELQLEMRDVMESYKSDDQTADPSMWSLGTVPTTSSFSTKTESTSYSFLVRTESKLRTIPESTSDSHSPKSSYSHSSSSSSATRSLGFKSINVNNEAQTSSSTFGPSSFSTNSLSNTSSAEKSVISFSFEDKDPTTNNPSSYEPVTDENDSTLSNSSKKQRGPTKTRSFDLPPKSQKRAFTSRSLPSLRKVLSWSRSSDQENSNVSCNSVGSKSSIRLSRGRKQTEPTDLDASPSGIAKLVSNELGETYPSGKLAHSFDLPSTQRMYSSPARSLPSPRRMFGLRSRSSEKKQASFSASQERDISDYTNLHPSTSFPLKLSTPEQTQSNPPKARSFDLPSHHMMVNLQSPDTDSNAKENISKESHSEPDINRSFCIPPEQAMDISTTASLPSTFSGEDIITSARELDTIPKKSPDETQITSSNTVVTEISEPSEEECFTLDKVTSASFEEAQYEDSITQDLRLLTVVRNSLDEKSQADSISTESMSVCTQDAILTDFAEEAINNIGRETYDITYILNELHRLKIDSIEDLLKANQKEFISLFSDKDLAMEMKRLLHEPEFEAHVDSIYEANVFLPIS